MPKWLVIGAIAAVILLVCDELAQRALARAGAMTAANAAEPLPPPAARAAAPAAPGAARPVVITASEPVWLQVYEKGGKQFIRACSTRAEFTPSRQRRPRRCSRPRKPEALRITVGNATRRPSARPAR